MESLADIDSRAQQLLIQRRYAEAEPLYRCSLLMREKQLGLTHPDVSVRKLPCQVDSSEVEFLV